MFGVKAKGARVDSRERHQGGVGVWLGEGEVEGMTLVLLASSVGAWWGTELFCRWGTMRAEFKCHVASRSVGG